MTVPTSPIGAVGDADAGPVDAVTRLEMSRQRLRRHLIELNGHPDEPDAGPPRPNALLDSLRSIPLVGMVLDTVSSWWKQHPLRVVATLVVASAASAARPVTQRHPTVTLFAALAIGALVMWARPWRFVLLRRAIYAGLLPQLVSKVIGFIPTDGWMKVADSMLNRGKAATAPTPTATATPPDVVRSSPSSSEPARTSPLH